MAIKQLCTLSRTEALKHLEYYKKYTIRGKSGIWNKYKDIDYKTAKSLIENSGYGADVSVDETNKFLLICCPCDSDMF